MLWGRADAGRRSRRYNITDAVWRRRVQSVPSLLRNFDGVALAATSRRSSPQDEPEDDPADETADGAAIYMISAPEENAEDAPSAADMPPSDWIAV